MYDPGSLRVPSYTEIEFTGTDREPGDLPTLLSSHRGAAVASLHVACGTSSDLAPEVDLKLALIKLILVDATNYL